MAIPPDAAVWRGAFDPSDLTNYVAQFGPLLVEGEVLQSIDVTTYAESAALGLTVLTGDEYGPFIANGTNVEVWFEVEESMRADAAFSARGTMLPVQITVETDAPRRFQRTFVLKVLQL